MSNDPTAPAVRRVDAHHV